MSLRSWVGRLLSGGSRADEVRSGRPEDTGGRPAPSAPDTHSTTGTTPNEMFVGRAGGDDPGYLDTGAEKRTAEGDEAAPDDR